MPVERLLTPDILAFVIPVVAILVGGTIAIVRMVITHRERMAKIGMGIDPDAQRKPGDSHPGR